MRRLWAWVVRKRDLQVTRRQLVAVHGAGGRAAVEDNGRPVVRDLCNERVVKRQNMTSHQSSSPHLTRLRSFHCLSHCESTSLVQRVPLHYIPIYTN